MSLPGYSDIVNGEHAEVIPKVSPGAFKSGPEVPRTIYPGLDDFLPECDGELVFIGQGHSLTKSADYPNSADFPGLSFRGFLSQEQPIYFFSSPGFLLVSDEVLSMDAAALEEDLAMLAGSPHNSGSWDSATLARAGQGKTLWIGEYHLVFGLSQ